MMMEVPINISVYIVSGTPFQYTLGENNIIQIQVKLSIKIEKKIV